MPCAASRIASNLPCSFREPPCTGTPPRPKVCASLNRDCTMPFPVSTHAGKANAQVSSRPKPPGPIRGMTRTSPCRLPLPAVQRTCHSSGMSSPALTSMRIPGRSRTDRFRIASAGPGRRRCEPGEARSSAKNRQHWIYFGRSLKRSEGNCGMHGNAVLDSGVPRALIDRDDALEYDLHQIRPKLARPLLNPDHPWVGTLPH
jgi:hypothetical protein